MAPASVPRSGPVTTVLTALLAVGLLVTTVLVVLLVSPRPANASVSVADPVAVECPPGQRAPYCYEIDLTNDGTVDTAARCMVSAPDGLGAEFTTGGLMLITDPWPPGETVATFVRINPTGDDVEPAPPLVTCDPIPA